MLVVVVRLVVVGRGGTGPWEVADIDRLQPLGVMGQWFHRQRNRTMVAGQWVAAELRAVRLGVGSV